uniref:Uncharacterized protein n=1 Tax=Sphaerodactylus townsendi TaxID=933632 RepID=A0ACB8FGF1_9SAUR
MLLIYVGRVRQSYIQLTRWQRNCGVSFTSAEQQCLKNRVHRKVSRMEFPPAEEERGFPQIILSYLESSPTSLLRVSEFTRVRISHSYRMRETRKAYSTDFRMVRCSGSNPQLVKEGQVQASCL